MFRGEIWLVNLEPTIDKVNSDRASEYVLSAVINP